MENRRFLTIRKHLRPYRHKNNDFCITCPATYGADCTQPLGSTFSRRVRHYTFYWIIVINKIFQMFS